MNLTGSGVIIAILDSGIDYFLPDFLDEKNKTRLIGIWDQSAPYDTQKGMTPPNGYGEGVFYSRKLINEALKEGYPKGLDIVPVRDTSGHGTAVAALAAGSINGIATQAEIMVIKLGKSINDSFPRTTQLMRGIDYAVKYAVSVNKPVVINISFGNTYGDHKGNSLLERFIDNASEIGRTSIIIGAGNEGVSNGHTFGTAFKTKQIELSVGRYETGFSLQLWKFYQDVFSINIISPGGETGEIGSSLILKSGTLRIRLENTELLCYIGKPQPYNVEQEIFIDFIPENDYITEGIWQLILTPKDVVTGEYRMYLSGYAARNTGTGFLNPSPDLTMTIPATSQKAVSVGAYDTVYKNYADFSGRGYVYRYDGNADKMIAGVKPDIAAPGVDITVPLPGGGYEQVSGTSFAAPITSGACALLMEWGIVKGNDKFLYGERLKARLISDAQKIEYSDTIPNSKIGWGALRIFSAF